MNIPFLIQALELPIVAAANKRPNSSTMGVGRRMKKQGPPAPLDESRISSLKKRKASEPEATAGGKRRRKNTEAAVPVRKALNGKPNPSWKRNTKDILTNGKTTDSEKARVAVKPAKAVVLGDESSDDDAADLLGDSILNEKVIGDGLEDNFLEGDDDLQDDFLGSGSSVYDSDPEHQTARFSDDDDSDAEEKLTAANFEGLSKQLESAQEEEAAEAAQELQDDALQTNIAGEPNDLSKATSAQLAPDLQLLRTRITDTI
ncbi:MAG: hypothetical protein Q9224_006498, partial [Gallowayella concinna]